VTGLSSGQRNQDSDGFEGFRVRVSLELLENSASFYHRWQPEAIVSKAILRQYGLPLREKNCTQCLLQRDPT
jgi:hypothetical protein